MSAVLFAFGLADMPMLGWLAVAAAPILIHIWSRRQYRETTWAAMDFLLAAIRRQTRRLRFEQWLLLVLRTLLIVLLVLAAAEPYGQRIGPLALPGEMTHRVLVLDGSFSMAFKPTEQTRFDRAKELARQIVEESRQGDGFSLVVMAAPPKTLIASPSLEQSEVLREIDQISSPYSTADLPATVAEIGRILESAKRDHPRLTRHEVYFLTDLHRVTWNPPLSGGSLVEFRRQSASLGETAALMILDVGQPAAENLAVTSLRCLDPLVVVNRSVNFEAMIRNSSRQPKIRQRVEFWCDGRRQEQKLLDIPPGSDSTTTFASRWESSGNHSVEVRIPGDALDVDNIRYLSVPVRQAVRVLCIDGHPSGERFQGAADYVASALSPENRLSGITHAHSPIQVEIAPDSALLERDLNRYDSLFLCNVAQFTANEARLLKSFVHQGGNLVILLGNQVQPDQYERELGSGVLPNTRDKKGTNADGRSRVVQDPTPKESELTKSMSKPSGDSAKTGRLLPAHLGPLVDRPQYRLDPLEFQHPIVKIFRGRGETALRTTPVFRYYRLEIPKESSARKVLALGNGDPLVVEEAMGLGRVVLVATSADAGWSGLPLWPSFLPLMQEILAYGLSNESRQRQVLVGEPFLISASTSAADAPVTLDTPGGPSLQLRLHSNKDGATFEFSDTNRSGIYRAKIGPPCNREEWFAVNPDTKESDLSQLSPDELQHAVWPGVRYLHQTSWQHVPTASSPTSITRPFSLQVDLLYAVLLLLVLETLLAWWFGYRFFQGGKRR